MYVCNESHPNPTVYTFTQILKTTQSSKDGRNYYKLGTLLIIHYYDSLILLELLADCKFIAQTPS